MGNKHVVFLGRKLWLRSLGQERHKDQWSRSLSNRKVKVLAHNLTQGRALAKGWEERGLYVCSWTAPHGLAGTSAWPAYRQKDTDLVHPLPEEMTGVTLAFKMKLTTDKNKSQKYWCKDKLSRWGAQYFSVGEQSKRLERTQFVKCLPHRHENLSLYLPNLI